MTEYNGHIVSDSCGVCLNKIQARLYAELGAEAAATIKGSCSRGQYGHDQDSGNTHRHGDAVDFLCGHWPAAWIRAMVDACHESGMQAVLRLVGDNDGSDRPVPVQHLHCAVNGKSNSRALAIVTKEPNGRVSLSKQLARRS